MKNESIGTRLKAQREACGKTLQQIADEVGIAKSTVQRYENDAITTPKLPVVTAIAVALGVAPEWLLGQTQDKLPNPTGECPAELEFKYALFGEAAELTPENRAKLIEMARFFKQQQEKQ